MNDENDDISHLDSALVARLHPPMYKYPQILGKKAG